MHARCRADLSSTMSLFEKTVDYGSPESKALDMRQSCALRKAPELWMRLIQNGAIRPKNRSSVVPWSEYLSARGGCREQDLETE